MDRLDTQRLLEPFRDPKRQASKANTRCVFRLLSRIEDSLGLEKQCPFPGPIASGGKNEEIPQLGGLHHRYEPIAA
jgi:hypothetical protein